MEPSFTKEELNKLTITPEDLAHYSQPDELKRLLLERNYYKLVLEKQNENIVMEILPNEILKRRPFFPKIISPSPIIVVYL